MSSEPSEHVQLAQADPALSGARGPFSRTWVLLLVVCAVIVLAYRSVLFDFFTGDDFGHLVWLREAVRYPELVLRNFHSSWLDSSSSKFYRPLISVFMLSDYLLFGAHGTGFHVTNLLFFLLSTIFLYFIVSELRKKLGGAAPATVAWPLSAALLFGLYPLHPEAVSWITGRVDVVVTTFSLGSLLFFMRWRANARRHELAGSLLCMVAALLSKEMAIVIPATMVVYELLNPPSENADRRLLSRLRETLMSTAPFWLLLVGYFMLRRWALGTFVGGYDDSLLSIANWEIFLAGWRRGLEMLSVPANRELMGSRNIFLILWEIGLIVSVVLLAIPARSAPGRRVMAFLLAWTAISLLPVYKIFVILDNLEGSRYGYLATVPLSCLFTLGCAQFIELALTSKTRKTMLACAAIAVSALMPVSAFYILSRNNYAWAEAGATSNAVRAALQRFYSATPGDPPVLILNLPDQFHGAYICRNAQGGMTRTPQLSRDLSHCQMVVTSDLFFPFGYVKNSLAKTTDNMTGKVQVLAWNPSNKTLVPFAASTLVAAPFSLSGEQLIHSLTPHLASCTLQATGKSVRVKAADPLRKPEVMIDPSGTLACFPTDFLVLDFEPGSGSSSRAIELEFENNIVDKFNRNDRSKGQFMAPAAVTAPTPIPAPAIPVVPAPAPPAVSTPAPVPAPATRAITHQTVIFPLRGQPNWAFGGNCRELLLRLPSGFDGELFSMHAMRAQQVMPMVSSARSDYLDGQGMAHIQSPADGLTVAFDATDVANAAGVILEVTRPNLPFTTPYSSQCPDKLCKQVPYPGAKGTIEIKRSLFPENAFYSLRLQAVNAAGTRLGVAGDHFLVSVE